MQEMIHQVFQTYMIPCWRRYVKFILRNAKKRRHVYHSYLSLLYQKD